MLSSIMSLTCVVFNNETNLYRKVNVKLPICLQLSGTLYFRRKTLHPGIFVVLMLFDILCNAFADVEF